MIGFVDQELLEFHWGPDWVVWDAQKTMQQHSQHVEYTLRRESETKTRVRFDITLEPSAPLPEFLVNRARKKVLQSATRGSARFRHEPKVGLGANPSLSADNRLIASSRVSSRLQKVKRTR